MTGQRKGPRARVGGRARGGIADSGDDVAPRRLITLTQASKVLGMPRGTLRDRLARLDAQHPGLRILTRAPIGRRNQHGMALLVDLDAADAAAQVRAQKFLSRRILRELETLEDRIDAVQADVFSSRCRTNHRLDRIEQIIGQIIGKRPVCGKP